MKNAEWMKRITVDGRNTKYSSRLNRDRQKSLDMTHLRREEPLDSGSEFTESKGKTATTLLDIYGRRYFAFCAIPPLCYKI